MIEQLTNEVPNPYMDVWHFFKSNHLPSERGDWRLTDYVLGEINGLPKSRGRVVATNGLMCYIQIAPDVLYYGHFTAWVPDEIESDRVPTLRIPKQAKVKQVQLFAEY